MPKSGKNGMSVESAVAILTHPNELIVGLSQVTNGGVSSFEITISAPSKNGGVVLVISSKSATSDRTSAINKVKELLADAVSIGTRRVEESSSALSSNVDWLALMNGTHIHKILGGLETQNEFCLGNSNSVCLQTAPKTTVS